MRSYNKRVDPREFKVGDFVLRKVLGNTKVKSDGKLGPNWEGPYKVVGIAGVGAYRLIDLDGIEVPRPWNAQKLILIIGGHSSFIVVVSCATETS